MFQYYGFRNVLLPGITLHFASISEIFGGSVLVEQVFSYPGLGQAAVNAGPWKRHAPFDGDHHCERPVCVRGAT